MRRLLLAALGAAGSLLIDLPALAQLSNTTSTFSGQMAASCSFNSPNNLSLNYDANQNLLRGESEFTVLRNSNEVTLNISAIQVINEPTPIASAVTPRLSIFSELGAILTANKLGEVRRPFEVTPNIPNRLNLVFLVTTSNNVENRFELPPGNYTYRATISCLQ